MQFQVTSIEFDFDDSAAYDKDPSYFKGIYEDYIGTIWEADDGDDLVEEITSAAGWCVLSIDYKTVLHSIP